VNGVIAWLHMHGWDGMAYWEQLANIRKENAQNKQERRGSLSCGLSKLTCSKTRAVTLGHETMAHTSPLLLSLSGSAAIPCCTGHVCTTRVRVCVCVCVCVRHKFTLWLITIPVAVVARSRIRLKGNCCKSVTQLEFRHCEQ